MAAPPGPAQARHRDRAPPDLLPAPGPGDLRVLRPVRPPGLPGLPALGGRRPAVRRVRQGGQPRYRQPRRGRSAAGCPAARWSPGRWSASTSSATSSSWSTRASVNDWALIGRPRRCSGRPSASPGPVVPADHLAFLHEPGLSGLGPLHIVFNMWALILVGPALERLLGRAAVPGRLPGQRARRLGAVLPARPAERAALGASGAIFGLFGAWFVVARRLRLDSRRIVVPDRAQPGDQLRRARHRLAGPRGRADRRRGCSPPPTPTRRARTGR